MADPIIIPIQVQGLDELVAAAQTAGAAWTQAFVGPTTAADHFSDAMEHLQPANFEALKPEGEQRGGGAEGGAGGRTGEAKEFAESVETAARGMELLTRSTEAFGRILTTGRLNVAVGGVNQIGEAVKSVSERFGEAGEKVGFMATAFTAAAAAIAGTGLALKELGEHAAEDVNRFHELAGVAGLTSGQFAALQTNFAQSGVGLETVERMVRIMSVRIQEEWGSLVHSVRTSGDELVKTQLDADSALRKEEEAESAARLAPFAQVQAEENLREAQAAQQFAPHGVARAEAGLEEAQLAIPQADLTADEAHTNLSEATLRFRKFFETHNAPGPGTEGQIEWQREQQRLQRAELSSKQAEIRDRETKATEGGIPEAEEGVRKAEFQAGVGAPHAVDEANEALIKSKHAEADASDQVTRSAIGVHEAFLRLQEFPQQNPSALASAIGAGGRGVNWAEVSAPNILQAIMLRAQNPATGVPDIPGMIREVGGFYNQAAVPEATKTALGAQITGQRGADLPQVIEAITKGDLFQQTDRSRGLAATADEFKAPAEQLRTVIANAGVDIEKSLIEAGGRLIPAAEKIDQGVASAIGKVAEDAGKGLDLVKAAYNDVADAGRGVVSVFNQINEAGIRSTPEFKTALVAHPEVQAAIAQADTAKTAVQTYGEQRLSGGEGTWEQRFHALQQDTQYQGLQTTAAEASQRAEALQHNLAVSIAPTQAASPFGGDKSVFDKIGELTGAGTDLKDAATQLKGAAQALKGSGTSGGGGKATESGLAGGGLIEGPGGPTDDAVSIRASAGEYVVKAATVKAHGVEQLDLFNDGAIGLAQGGEMPSPGTASSPSTGASSAEGLTSSPVQGPGIPEQPFSGVGAPLSIGDAPSFAGGGWMAAGAATVGAETSTADDRTTQARDAAEAALGQSESLGGGLGISGAIAAGSEAGNREVLADPKVQERLKKSDERKEQNFAEHGWARGSWENLRESFGRAEGGPTTSPGDYFAQDQDGQWRWHKAPSAGGLTTSHPADALQNVRPADLIQTTYASEGDRDFVKAELAAAQGQAPSSTAEASTAPHPIDTLQVPRERRTDEQIRANYAENLDVEKETAPTRTGLPHELEVQAPSDQPRTGEAHTPEEARALGIDVANFRPEPTAYAVGEAKTEDDARRLGIIPDAPSHGAASAWDRPIPEEERPNFARAMAADRDAERRRSLGLPPRSLNDFGPPPEPVDSENREGQVGRSRLWVDEFNQRTPRPESWERSRVPGAPSIFAGEGSEDLPGRRDRPERQPQRPPGDAGQSADQAGWERWHAPGSPSIFAGEGSDEPPTGRPASRETRSRRERDVQDESFAEGGEARHHDPVSRETGEASYLKPAMEVRLPGASDLSADSGAEMFGAAYATGGGVHAASHEAGEAAYLNPSMKEHLPEASDLSADSGGEAFAAAYRGGGLTRALAEGGTVLAPSHEAGEAGALRPSMEEHLPGASDLSADSAGQAFAAAYDGGGEVGRRSEESVTASLDPTVIGPGMVSPPEAASRPSFNLRQAFLDGGIIRFASGGNIDGEPIRIFPGGGPISGPGGPTEDAIPAWVSNGEFIVKASRVAELGVDKMHDLNEGRIGFARGDMAHFAEGGPVDLSFINNLGGSIDAPHIDSSVIDRGEGGRSEARQGAYHILDIRTDSMVVRGLPVANDTLESLEKSSIGSKLTRSSVMPSWRT